MTIIAFVAGVALAALAAAVFVAARDHWRLCALEAAADVIVEAGATQAQRFEILSSTLQRLTRGASRTTN